MNEKRTRILFRDLHHFFAAAGGGEKTRENTAAVMGEREIGIFNPSHQSSFCFSTPGSTLFGITFFEFSAFDGAKSAVTFLRNIVKQEWRRK